MEKSRDYINVATCSQVTPVETSSATAAVSGVLCFSTLLISANILKGEQMLFIESDCKISIYSQNLQSRLIQQSIIHSLSNVLFGVTICYVKCAFNGDLDRSL